MITLRNVSLRRGKDELIKNLNWTIYEKQRFGIIGENGCGKTSLFALLLRQLTPDLGEVEISNRLRIAHVAQETPGYADKAIDYVLDGDTYLRTLEAQLSIAEEQHLGDKIAEIHEKLYDHDAYTAPARAAQLLAGLGFDHHEQQKSVNEFSGGWRVRLNLAKALMTPSDILLLDEPTNHLDLDAVLWLEQWLNRYSGTLLLISHDREFLDKTIDNIAYIAHQTVKTYSGNYSTFENQRATDLMVQQASYDKQQKQIAHMQSFVNRFKAKASKAKQAQSRVKALEKMDIICAVQAESVFQFHFRKPKLCPNPLIFIDKATIAYDANVILSNLSLSLTPKDRIAILGPNGAGKSSFIKLLADEIAAAKGHVEKSAGLKIGYFAQHQVDKLHLDASPLLHLQRINDKHKSELELRKFLGSFGFSGDRVNEEVKIFSGGEKSRLALALIVWEEPNLLLLDEPTNHLDLEMRNALSIALQEYEGAMILVSHDRFLVRSTTDQLLLVANGKLQEFDGDLNDYQKWLLDFRKQTRKEQKEIKVDTTEKAPSGNKKEWEKRILQLEKKIETLHDQKNELEQKLSAAEIYNKENKAELEQLLQSQQALVAALIQHETEWLEACETKNNLE